MKSFESGSLFLFPTHVTVTNSHEFLKQKNFYVKEIYNQIAIDSDGIQASNDKGYHGKYDQLIHNSIIRNLIDPIIDYNIKNNYGFKDNVSWSYNSIWINLNKPGCSNAPHVHFNSQLSGIFYVKVPLNSGTTRFFNPSLMYPLEGFKLQSFLERSLEYSCYIWNPVEGQLLMFPSTLLHDVNANQSNDERITISFNLNLFCK
jgi:uncharacterized protein (TIGR02466 family)